MKPFGVWPISSPAYSEPVSDISYDSVCYKFPCGSPNSCPADWQPGEFSTPLLQPKLEPITPEVADADGTLVGTPVYGNLLTAREEDEVLTAMFNYVMDEFGPAIWQLVRRWRGPKSERAMLERKVASTDAEKWAKWLALYYLDN